MNKKKLFYRSLGKIINVTAALFPKWNREYSFKLLCKVTRVGVTESGKIFFANGKTTFITVDEQKIALHKWGTGSKKILFVHGWMSNAQRWQPYVDSLNLKEYTAYALDGPAHGLSEGTSLNVEVYRKAIIQSLDIIGTVDTIVCHSLGSMVTGYAYLVNPKLDIDHYIIMGTPSGMDAIFHYFQAMLKLSDKAIANLKIKANQILKIPSNDVSIINFFSKVEKPTLVIHEKTDLVTPFQPIEKGIQQNAHIQSYFTQGLGHNLESEEVVNRVLEYITTPSYKPLLQE